FTYSGLSSSSSLTSRTSPLRGAYNSETVLTDSTLPNGSSFSNVSPTSGSSTKTISPSSSCANEVMPIRTLSSSFLIHSCSSEYKRSSGKCMPIPPLIITIISLLYKVKDDNSSISPYFHPQTSSNVSSLNPTVT